MSAYVCERVCVCVLTCTHMHCVCKGRKGHEQKGNIELQEGMLHSCAISDLKKMTSDKYLGIFTSLHSDRSQGQNIRTTLVTNSAFLGKIAY